VERSDTHHVVASSNRMVTSKSFPWIGQRYGYME
jgi:hypothetical protein